MAIKYLSSLDLSGLELKKLRIENFSTVNEPAGLAAGHVYFNTTDGKLNVFDGTNWNEVGSSLIAGDGISVAADGVTVSVDNSVIRTSGDQSINGVLSTTGMIIDGDLTIKGDYVMTAPETVAIQDNIILLNSNVKVDEQAREDAGIEVNRGGSEGGNLSLFLREEGPDSRWVFTLPDSSVNVIPVPSEYNNYTYAISTVAGADSSQVKIRLAGGGVNDDVVIKAGNNVTVSQASDVITINAVQRTNNEIEDLAGGLIAGASLYGLSAAYTTSNNTLAMYTDVYHASRVIVGTAEPFVYNVADWNNTLPLSVTLYELDGDRAILVHTDVVHNRATREITFTTVADVQYDLLIIGTRA